MTTGKFSSLKKDAFERTRKTKELTIISSNRIIITMAISIFL
jgi:hypothetical protein